MAKNFLGIYDAFRQFQIRGFAMQKLTSYGIICVTIKEAFQSHVDQSIGTDFFCCWYSLNYILQLPPVFSTDLHKQHRQNPCLMLIGLTIIKVLIVQRPRVNPNATGFKNVRQWVSPKNILLYSYTSAFFYHDERGLFLQQVGKNTETNSKTLCREWPQNTQA